MNDGLKRVNIVSAANLYDEVRQILNTQKSNQPLMLTNYSLTVGKDRNQCEDRTFTDQNFIAVADGVSWWSDYNIDSGVFAENLIQNCYEIFLETQACESTSSNSPLFTNSDNYNVQWYSIVSRALEQILYYGSTTLILAWLKNQTLHVYSIGDSKLCILRQKEGKYAILEQTKMQQHSICVPYQLSKLPPQLYSQIQVDSVEDGNIYKCDLQPKDIILVGSDGFWDNIFAKDILMVVNNYKDDIEELCKILMKRSFSNSHSRVQTPFQMAYNQQATDQKWRGGKQDDICLIASFVEY